MIHRKTYRLFEGEDRELVYEDTMNERGQTLSFKDHQSQNQTEGFNEYDVNGLLVCERELMDGEEGTRTEYVYNAQGDITGRRLFVAGEVFEELTHEYSDKGVVKRTVRHGEEIEHIVESKDGDLVEFFDGAELIQSHKATYDPDTRIELIEVTDHEGQILATRYQLFDEAKKNILKFEEKSEKGDTLALTEYRYENGQLVFQGQTDYVNDQYYDVHFEYDAHGNEISMEVKTDSGKLLEYQKKIFDDQNRLIGESGYSVGSFNAVYGTYVNGEKYTFEHEYVIK